MQDSQNYWLVGAMWDRGTNDQYSTFIKEKIWILGWSEEDQPAQARLRDQIKVEDRIAIKRMLGQGSTEIEIRAIGIVTNIELSGDERKIFVNWVIKDLKRRVPSNGAYKSISGPFRFDDEITKEAFRF